MKKSGWRSNKILILFFITAIITVILLPSSLALSLTGNKLSPIIYEPGKVIVNKYKIDGTSAKTEVELGGDLLEYITLSEVVNGEFTMTIRFPDKFITPGSYSFSLSVQEVSDSPTAGVGSLISVSKVFLVEVYSHEKAIEASLSAADINKNGTVPFIVSVRSRTYSDIDKVKADIYIYDQNNKSVGKVQTKEAPLKALRTIDLKSAFNATGLPAGNYAATALISFDGKKDSVETAFKIGSLDVSMLNYTSMLEQGFSTFTVDVVNLWGNTIQNVYAKLFIQNQELLQTPSINLEPWQAGQLKGIVKINLAPGEYDGEVQLFFEGESKKEKISIMIIPSASEKKGLLLYLLIGGIGVIIILTAIITGLLWKKKRIAAKLPKEGKGEQKKKSGFNLSSSTKEKKKEEI